MFPAPFMSQGTAVRKSRPGLGGPLIPTPLLLPSCLLGEGRTQKPDLSSLQPLPPLPQFPPGLKEAKENRALLRLPLSLPLPHFLLGEDGLLAPPSPPWQILALVSSFCRAPRVKRLDSNWTLISLHFTLFMAFHPRRKAVYHSCPSLC